MSDTAAQVATDETRENLRRAVYEATVATGGLYPTVIIDGTTTAVPAIPTADVPSQGQRVLVTYGTDRGRFTGHVWITGTIGGIQRHLGTNGTATAQTGISTETDLEESAGERLEVTTQILHPGQVVVVHGHVRLEQASGSPAPILRAYAEDEDGTVFGIGICDESPVLGAGENNVLDGEATWSKRNPATGSVGPDPGNYVFYLSVANPSGSIDTLAAASQQSATWLRVECQGADA